LVADRIFDQPKLHGQRRPHAGDRNFVGFVTPPGRRAPLLDEPLQERKK
jgi:hypothetical protein